MNFSEIISQLSVAFHSDLVPSVVQLAIAFSPIILPVFLFPIAWNLWMSYIRLKFFNSLKYTVLELKLPQETFKSPFAMETIIQSIHNTADGSFVAQYWKGEIRPWYSLELVSLGGQVKFMIWLEDRRKVTLMALLYAQFKGIEIIEREDYTKSVHWDASKIRIWAAEYVLEKEDYVPIKTYVDFGLDKDPKEEFKIDPLVNIIEFLGSVPPNAQIWFQIMLRAHKKEQKVKDKWLSFDKTDAFIDAANKKIDDIMVRNISVGQKLGKDPKDPKIEAKHKIAGLSNSSGFVTGPALTPAEVEMVKAIERKKNKILFDVGIRALYISPKDKYDGPYAIGGVISCWRQFNWEGFNGFKGNKEKWFGQFASVPWEDFQNIRRDMVSEDALAAYKRRSFFYYPYASKPIVLNTEELATIWHFPGSVSSTPALERVPSKKGTAPSNLPTG